jgi:hypothetical protein
MYYYLTAEEKEKFLRTTGATSLTNNLLIDADNKLRELWGVPKALFGVFPGMQVQ